LTTRDTVIDETPAARATSAIVGLLRLRRGGPCEQRDDAHRAPPHAEGRTASGVRNHERSRLQWSYQATLSPWP